VSHRLGCIYLETPKAACTSIKKALGISIDDLHVACAAAYFEKTYGASVNIERLGPEHSREFSVLLDRARKEISSLSTIQTPKDGDFSMFNGSIDEVLRCYPDYFSFAFVRDPFSKIVSTWQMFCKTSNPFRTHQIETLFGESAEGITLHSFIARLCSVDNHHWNPYINYLPEFSRLNFVGSLENLAADWKHVSAALGVERPLSHENRSHAVSAALTLDDISILEILYGADMEVFQYHQGHL
jgi:hypothetical protein